MRIEFMVGKEERHHVVVFYERVTQTITLFVDGKPFMDEKVWILWDTGTRGYPIGTKEVHWVEIRIERELFLPRLGRHQFIIFVDGKVVSKKSFTGGLKAKPTFP